MHDIEYCNIQLSEQVWRGQQRTLGSTRTICGQRTSSLVPVSALQLVTDLQLRLQSAIKQTPGWCEPHKRCCRSVEATLEGTAVLWQTATVSVRSTCIGWHQKPLRR
jgi:hypothetical protein